MTPILFEANATTFTTFGIGALVDAENCDVSMNENTSYELTMDYPVDGVLFSDITGNRIIYAKPCQTDDPQPFRVYRMTKPINGKVTFYARHVSYDLLGIPVLPFTASSANDFCTKIISNSVVTNPFAFSTNISKTEDLEFTAPQTARSMMTDGDNSWAKLYGGELVFDKYDVKLLSAAGQNRGVVIKYGVDLVDANMEENIASVYTGILPYFSKDGTIVTGDVQNAPGTYLITRVLLVDVTEYISSNNPTKATVNSVGQTWLEENLVYLPKVSLSLSYAQIDQTVRLFDTVSVKFEKLGIDVVAKISGTVYDVLKERYKSVNVGDVRQTFAVDMYDASRLKTGLLDLKRIKDRSIGGEKMASGGVGGRAIASSAITSAKIATDAITEQKIANSAISAVKLADSAVTYDKLASSVAGYFTGNNQMSVNASQIRLNGKRFRITSDGYVMIEGTS